MGEPPKTCSLAEASAQSAPIHESRNFPLSWDIALILLTFHSH
jgi:hypothetical protein